MTDSIKLQPDPAATEYAVVLTSATGDSAEYEIEFSGQLTDTSGVGFNEGAVSDTTGEGSVGSGPDTYFGIGDEVTVRAVGTDSIAVDIDAFGIQDTVPGGEFRTYASDGTISGSGGLAEIGVEVSRAVDADRAAKYRVEFSNEIIESRHTGSADEIINDTTAEGQAGSGSDLYIGTGDFVTVGAIHDLDVRVVIPAFDVDEVVSAGFEKRFESDGSISRRELDSDEVFEPEGFSEDRVWMDACDVGLNSIPVGGGTFELELTVRNENPVKAFVSPEVAVTGRTQLNKRTQPINLDAGQTRTVTRSVSLIDIEVSNLGGEGRYPIEAGIHDSNEGTRSLGQTLDPIRSGGLQPLGRLGEFASIREGDAPLACGELVVEAPEATIQVQDWSVSPQPPWKAGQQVTIEATFANTSSVDGSISATVQLNGTDWRNISTTVPANDTVTMDTSLVIPEDIQSAEITIEGGSGSGEGAVFDPELVTISGCNRSPQTITAGEQVEFQATVSNDNDVAVDVTVEWSVGGQQVASASRQVSGNGSQTLTATAAVGQTGTNLSVTVEKTSTQAA